MRGTSQHGGVPRHRSIFRKTHTLNNNFLWIKRLKYCWLFFRPFLRFFFFLVLLMLNTLTCDEAFLLKSICFYYFTVIKKMIKKLTTFFETLFSPHEMCVFNVQMKWPSIVSDANASKFACLSPNGSMLSNK